MPDPAEGKIWVDSAFGAMGLGVQILADPRDPRLAHLVRFPNGATSTQFTPALGTWEMLAWSRWQLGWLDATQIRCVTEPTETVDLSPIADSGEGIAMAAAPAAGQESDSAATEVRITARKLADGRVEFGLQQRASSSDPWGQRQLPRVRFFPTTATAGRWLNSSPLEVNDNQTRITARKLADGRVEFGLQQRASSSDPWGQRQLPRVRFFPTTATAGRWLNSSPLATTTATGTTTSGARYTAITAGRAHTCALGANGAITCWGLNDDGRTDAPDGRYTAITAGDAHTCALGANGAITCWGNNSYGQTDAPDGS